MAELLKTLNGFREDMGKYSHEHDRDIFFSVMQNLISFLSGINDPLTLKAFRGSDYFRDHRSFFISRQSSYYHAIESAEALSLREKHSAQGQSILDIFDRGFSKNAYLRIKDALEFVDFSVCETFIMVGCGPLPATLFCIHENTNVQKIIGVDNNREAVDTAVELLERHKIPRIQIKHATGINFNYQEADIIYVANLVSPKKKILNQIIETAKNDVQLILRDPCGMGILLSESGMEDLDPRLRLIGEGIENKYFLSKHFFLQRS